MCCTCLFSGECSPVGRARYSRHSTAACVSASSRGPECYEDFDGGSADYAIEDVGAVDTRPLRQ